MNISLKDINWGADESVEDPYLPQYFVHPPEFNDIIKGKIRYIIGRKGTGKSAICEMIRRKSELDPLVFTSLISLRNLPIVYLENLRDKSLFNKSQLVPAWTFLILIELARLILEDQGASPSEEICDLEKFIFSNFDKENLGFASTINRLHETKFKVSIFSKWFGGAEKTDKSESHTLTEIHYQIVTEILYKQLKKINSSSSFYLILDNLDEGYSSKDINFKTNHLSIFRAAEDIYLNFKDSTITVIPIVVLRSDIFYKLDDNDLNKIDDSLLILKWTGKTGVDYSLRNIVSSRIKASACISRDIQCDPWCMLADPYDSLNFQDGNLTGQDRLWWYMIQRTSERPRDILKYLKKCSSKNPNGIIDKETVVGGKSAEKSYSDWLYREIGNEIQSYLPVWREAINCITNIGYQQIKPGLLESEISKNRHLCKWMEEENCTPQDICEILYNSFVIGNFRRSERWLFKFQDETLTWNPELPTFVHHGLTQRLRLQRYFPATANRIII